MRIVVTLLISLLFFANNARAEWFSQRAPFGKDAIPHLSAIDATVESGKSITFGPYFNRGEWIHVSYWGEPDEYIDNEDDRVQFVYMRGMNAKKNQLALYAILKKKKEGKITAIPWYTLDYHSTKDLGALIPPKVYRAVIKHCEQTYPGTRLGEFAKVAGNSHIRMLENTGIKKTVEMELFDPSELGMGRDKMSEPEVIIVHLADMPNGEICFSIELKKQEINDLPPPNRSRRK